MILLTVLLFYAVHLNSVLFLCLREKGRINSEEPIKITALYNKGWEAKIQERSKLSQFS